MHTEKNFLETDPPYPGGGGGGLKKVVSLLILVKQIKCLRRN